MHHKAPRGLRRPWQRRTRRALRRPRLWPRAWPLLTAQAAAASSAPRGRAEKRTRHAQRGQQLLAAAGEALTAEAGGSDVEALRAWRQRPAGRHAPLKGLLVWCAIQLRLLATAPPPRLLRLRWRALRRCQRCCCCCCCSLSWRMRRARSACSSRMLAMLLLLPLRPPCPCGVGQSFRRSKLHATDHAAAMTARWRAHRRPRLPAGVAGGQRRRRRQREQGTALERARMASLSKMASHLARSRTRRSLPQRPTNHRYVAAEAVRRLAGWWIVAAGFAQCWLRQ